MKKAPFNISIESDYKELWRYNLALIGEVAVAGERVDVVRHLDEVASVGDNLKVAPQGYNPNRNVEIELNCNIHSPTLQEENICWNAS